MEEKIELGKAGELDIVLSGGKAVLSLAPQGLGVSVALTLDSQMLADLLFAAIEKASPAGAVPVEEAIKNGLKEVLSKL